MDENEITEAIKRGKLPTTTADKVSMGLFLLIATAICIITIQNGTTFFLFIIASIILIGIISAFRYNKLTPYMNTLSINKKALVLYQIADGPDVYNVEKENNSYNIYFKAGWFVYAYKVIILYDDSGYYITSHAQYYNRGAGVRVNKTKQIIDKIKKLEAEL